MRIGLGAWFLIVPVGQEVIWFFRGSWMLFKKKIATDRKQSPKLEQEALREKHHGP